MPREEVLAAFGRWAERARRTNEFVVRIGCFGSYARGDHVPSSDLDVFVEVEQSRHERFFDRGLDELPDPAPIPVGVELFVYTSDEVERLRDRGSSWLDTVEREAIWL